MDLFDESAPESAVSPSAAAAGRDDKPLAERMRPRTLDEVLGQEALVGPGGLLKKLAERGDIPSLVFWGPPGSGKTTLARALAKLANAHFEPFSAVLGGVKEVREIVLRAKDRKARGLGRTLLFVDEIHRFNKGQQDAFLPHVEDGTLVLVGATTENPSFALNAALLSRCRVMRLAPLGQGELVKLLERALVDEDQGLGKTPVSIAHEVLEVLAEQADGDARRALNDLEIVAQLAARRAADEGPLDVAALAGLFDRTPLRHDRAGDQHHDVVSAFIKSLRGSDPDAALYYMARLLEAGDDPRFILRRLVVFASEDVGNADPRALGMAVDGLHAYQLVGMPEGRIILGQVTTYLATAPKSNASYLAVDRALEVARTAGSVAVPMKLRNAPTRLMKEMGHGDQYRYPHDHGGFVPEHYLPEPLRGEVFYKPEGAGYEKQIAERLERWRALRDAAD